MTAFYGTLLEKGYKVETSFLVSLFLFFFFFVLFVLPHWVNILGDA
jgi:hypothetical protein